jgi:hypothetical protein
LLKKLFERPGLAIMLIILIAVTVSGVKYAYDRFEGHLFSDVIIAKGKVIESYKRITYDIGENDRTGLDDYRVNILLEDGKTTVISRNEPSHYNFVEDGETYFVSYYKYDNTILDISIEEEELITKAFPKNALIPLILLASSLIYVVYSILKVAKAKKVK